MLATLLAQTEPEIKRTPLDSLVLQVKLLALGPIRDFMHSLLDPPQASAVTAAIRNLKELGAIQAAPASPSAPPKDRDYELTPLGYHVGCLPLDVCLAKALIFGAVLRCVDPLLTIVASLSERSPFRPITPATDDETRAAIERGRAAFAWGQSDHLAVVRAFNGWREAGAASASASGSRAKAGQLSSSSYGVAPLLGTSFGDGRDGGHKAMAARRAYADAHGLSHETLRGIADLRLELAAYLADLGFLQGRKGGAGGRGGGRKGQANNDGEYDDEEDADNPEIEPGTARSSAPSPSSGPWGRYGELSGPANACAGDVNVVRAALVAGLYPKVTKVVPPPRRYHETSGGAVATDYKPEEIRFYTLVGEEQDEEEEEEAGEASKAGSRAAGGASAKGRAQGGRPGKDSPSAPLRKLLSSHAIGGGARKSGSGPGALASLTAYDGDGDSSDDEDEDWQDEGCAPDLPAPKIPGTSAGAAQAQRFIMQYGGFTQERVFLHPGSMLFSVGEFRCPWLVFHEKAATGKVYLRDATVVTPMAMVLFGGPLTIQHRKARVQVGDRGWVSFHCEPRIAVLAKALRGALARLLAGKIESPDLDISGSPVIEAILRLLRGNGM